MRMYQINNYLQAHTVSSIDQILELIRRTRPRGDSEETSDVVPKTSVVRMLLDCHQLDYIVPSFFDSWKNMIDILSI